MLSSLALDAAGDVAGLRSILTGWRAAGERIGFVPTMGALHDGHISLIDEARKRSDKVVASIFVNPAQFAPGEDFETYPRTLPDDAEKLRDAGCDLLYAPQTGDMYPDGFATSVHVDGPAFGLESETRPHFFGGVATVVTKLLNQVAPDLAVFGEKDYQQLLVIRRLVRDLDLPVEIVGAPTARAGDGLALSSRNAYLSETERARAGELNAILNALARAVEAGEPVPSALTEARNRAAGLFDATDYIELRDSETLAPLPEGPLTREARALAAVKLGGTRLIDNRAVAPPRG